MAYKEFTYRYTYCKCIMWIPRDAQFFVPYTLYSVKSIMKLFCCMDLKGLCHEMNKVLKIKSVLSLYAPIVITFFCCLVMEKIKDTVLA
jgi:hypothetical protein